MNFFWNCRERTFSTLSEIFSMGLSKLHFTCGTKIMTKKLEKFITFSIGEQKVFQLRVNLHFVCPEDFFGDFFSDEVLSKLCFFGGAVKFYVSKKNLGF